MPRRVNPGWTILAAAATALSLDLRTAGAEGVPAAGASFSAAGDLYRRGAWREAACEFDSVATGDSGDRAAATLFAAECFAQLYDYRAVQVRLESLLQSEATPRDVKVQALFRAGEAAHKLGQSDGAQRRLKEFLAAAPDHRFAKYAEQYLGELESAEIAAAKRSEVVARESWIASREEAASLESSERFDEAAVAYRAALQNAASEQDRAESASRLGRMLVRVERFREAATALEAAVAVDEIARPADRLALARVYRRLERGEDAERILSSLAAESTGSGESFEASYELAALDLQMGRLPEAERRLQQLEDRLRGVPFPRNPSAPQATFPERTLTLLAQVEIEARRWDAAEKSLGRLVEIASPAARAEAEFWLGEIDFRRARFEDAAERFRSVDAFRERRSAEGRSPTAWMSVAAIRLVQIDAERGRWRDVATATGELSQLPPMEPFHAELALLSARAAAACGDGLRARTTLREEMNRESFDDDAAARAQWLIAETYFHERDYEAAEGCYRTLVELGRSPAWQVRAALQAGKCCEIAGRWSEARRTYRDAATRFSDCSTAAELSARADWLDRLAERTATFAPAKTSATPATPDL